MPKMQSSQDTLASALSDLFDTEARNMLTPTAIVDQLDRYIVVRQLFYPSLTVPSKTVTCNGYS
jgi:hypothetical protein